MKAKKKLIPIGLLIGILLLTSSVFAQPKEIKIDKDLTAKIKLDSFIDKSLSVELNSIKTTPMDEESKRALLKTTSNDQENMRFSTNETKTTNLPVTRYDSSTVAKSVYNAPIAELKYAILNPDTIDIDGNITTDTQIAWLWSYNGENFTYDPDGDAIVDMEVGGIPSDSIISMVSDSTGNIGFVTHITQPGKYTMTYRCQDETGLWSDTWTISFWVVSTSNVPSSIVFDEIYPADQCDYGPGYYYRVRGYKPSYNIKGKLLNADGQPSIHSYVSITVFDLTCEGKVRGINAGYTDENGEFDIEITHDEAVYYGELKYNTPVSVHQLNLLAPIIQTKNTNCTMNDKIFYWLVYVMPK